MPSVDCPDGTAVQRFTIGDVPCKAFLPATGTAGLAMKAVGADLKINIVEDPAEGDYSEGILNIIDMHNIDMAEFGYGKVSAMCGRAAYEYIEKGIQLTLEGKADAISTAPINKEAIRAAGVEFIGHTEIFAAPRSPHLRKSIPVDDFFPESFITLVSLFYRTEKEGAFPDYV